jgi:hypothetical protein
MIEQKILQTEISTGSLKSVGCPLCLEVTKFDFIWPEVFFEEKFILEKIETLRTGEELFGCSCCNTLWVRDLSGSFIRFKKTEFFERWNSQPQICPEKFLEVLVGIGKTNFMSIPCAATLPSGEHFESCELHFVDELPLWQTLGRRSILISEVQEISPSIYALPQNIREKTSENFEIRMGLSRTAIESSTGGVYLLHGIKNFFCQDGFTGSDIKTIKDKYDDTNVKPYKYFGPEPVVLIADFEEKFNYW